MDRGDPPVTQRPVALSVAGSDSSAGAGVQADLKTFSALGVYGVTAITAITAQNTLGVRAIHVVPAPVVAAQMEAAFEDFDVAAVKIGMLGAAEIAQIVAAQLGARRAFVVYDPVLASSSGASLARAGVLETAKARLLKRVDCLTPNLAEAAAFLGVDVARDEDAMRAQGQALLKLGVRAVLMKGGHLDGDAVDWLVTPDGDHRFAAPRIDSANLHGTGCTLSSGIAAYVTLGEPLLEAVRLAKIFVRDAIEAGRGGRLGQGAGPLIQMPLRQS
jgi:hydroxymethylpyrimidine/phosphomethylpyrimidine kinase